MPGTLTISTLSDGTNSTSATNPILGSAKAWVNFNGSSGAIRASYNVSSISINTTGDYTVNFTNSFADANYSAVFGGGDVNGGTAWGLGNSNPSTTAIRIISFAYNGALLANTSFCYVAVFR